MRIFNLSILAIDRFRPKSTHYKRQIYYCNYLEIKLKYLISLSYTYFTGTYYEEKKYLLSSLKHILISTVFFITFHEC